MKHIKQLSGIAVIIVVHAVTACSMPASDQYVWLAIESENRFNSNCTLKKTDDGEWGGEVALGRAVVFGTTEDRLAVFGRVGGLNMFRVWDLNNGELLSSTVIKDLEIYPMAARNLAVPGLVYDESSSQILYCGIQTRSVSRNVDGLISENKESVRVLAGIDTRSGDAFEVESPQAYNAGTAWRYFRGSWGVPLDEKSFGQYDPRTHSLEVLDPSPPMDVGTIYVDNVGVVRLERMHGLTRLTDNELKDLDHRQKVEGEIDGFREPAYSDELGFIVVEANREESGSTRVRVKPFGEDIVLFERNFSLEMSTIQVSSDGDEWIIADYLNKEAVHFVRSADALERVVFHSLERPHVFGSLNVK